MENRKQADRRQCREHCYKQMESALKTILAWASFDYSENNKLNAAVALDPEAVIYICNSALGIGR